MAITAAGAAANAAPTFTYNGNVQTYNVALTGEYDITVAGAQGGGNVNATGGLGAIVGGEFVHRESLWSWHSGSPGCHEMI